MSQNYTPFPNESSDNYYELQYYTEDDWIIWNYNRLTKKETYCIYDRAEINAVQKQYNEENCDWSIFCHYWSNFAKFQIPTDPNERSKETKILNHFK